MRQYIYDCVDIEWDCDDPEITLPCLVEVYIDKDFADKAEEDELVEVISNKLTKRTGFCHKGFNYNKVGVIATEPGVCPYCGSDDVEYGTIDIDGDVLWYENQCNSCKEWFNEYYKLEFIGSRTDSANPFMEEVDDGDY